MRRSLPEVLASLICNLLMLAVLAWIAYSTLRLLFNGLKLFIKWLYQKILGFKSKGRPVSSLLQTTVTSGLETPILVARDGAVIFENIDDASMRRLIRNHMVVPTDYFFRQGMKEWAPVSQYT